MRIIGGDDRSRGARSSFPLQKYLLFEEWNLLSENGGLASFHNDDFCIGTVRAILADDDIALVAGDAVAAAVALLHLIAPVCCCIVEEFHRVAVQKVGLIDERALQDDEVVNVQLGESEGIHLIDELLLEGMMGERQRVRREIPAFERREKAEQHLLVFALAELLPRVGIVFPHVCRAIFSHFLHGEVGGEGSVFEAVEAIVFALAAVGVRSAQLVGEGHAAALAKSVGLVVVFHGL